MSKFKYRSNSSEAADSVGSTRGNFDSMFKDGIETYKPEEGRNRIRVLPRTWTDEHGPRHWAFPVFINWDVGDRQSYLSRHHMLNEPDPIHDAYLKARGEGDEEYAKQLKASKQVITWVIDRNNPDKGPLLWRMPLTKIHNEIKARSQDPDTGEVLPVDHPEDGYDITFERQGSGMTTAYIGVDIARKASPLSSNDREMEEWLDFIEENPIPAVLKYYSCDHIEKAFKGTSPHKHDDDDDEDEEPPRTRSSRRSDPEPDEDADDLDELDEPEEEPRRARGKLKDDVDEGLSRRRRARS